MQRGLCPPWHMQGSVGAAGCNPCGAADQHQCPPPDPCVLTGICPADFIPSTAPGTREIRASQNLNAELKLYARSCFRVAIQVSHALFQVWTCQLVFVLPNTFFSSPV